MKRCNKNRLGTIATSFMSCWLLALVSVAQPAGNTTQVQVRDNSIYITLSGNLPLSSLDSFIRRYSLADLGLYSLLTWGRRDSLLQAGWTLEGNARSAYKIYKGLARGADLKSLPDKMMFSSIPPPDNWKPLGGNRSRYGFNRFRPGRQFSQHKDTVFFSLRHYEKAKAVKLAGSFTNWQYGALPLRKTADGWMIAVKLSPGQYYYKFIIDNREWITDPDNLLSENDGEGNINSVFFVVNKIFFLPGYPYARSVYLTGSFNNWAPNQIPLDKNREGWGVGLYLEPGTHIYNFLVDGKIVEAQDGPKGKESTVALGKPTAFILKGFKNAHSVVLAGDFNGWKEDALLMERTADGWKTAYVLGPGNYQYKYIVDGNWITDPANPAIVDDGLGNLNSFLVVAPNYTFRLKGYAKARGVHLAGDFNNWSSSGLPMTRAGDEWICAVYLSKGKHLYKFIADNKWMKDPANPLWEDDFENSVLWIK
jgi:hypothetical protein